MQQHYRLYKCKLCTKSYTRKEGLQVHISEHRPPYKCLVCNKRFGDFKSFTIHMAVHENVTFARRRKCNFCHKVFLPNDNLEEHFKLHHEQDLTMTTFVERHKCNICRKVFSQKQNLEEHIKVHQDQIPSTMAIKVER